MNIEDAAKLLELKAPFTSSQAKTNYRRLAMKHHPDKGGNTEKMKRLNEAYSLCSMGIKFGSCPKIDLSGVKFKTKKHSINIHGVISWFSSQILEHLITTNGNILRADRAENLYLKMLEESLELRAAIGEKNKKKIIKKCASVASFAMIIADSARRKL